MSRSSIFASNENYLSKITFYNLCSKKNSDFCPKRKIMAEWINISIFVVLLGKLMKKLYQIIIDV